MQCLLYSSHTTHIDLQEDIIKMNLFPPLYNLMHSFLNRVFRLGLSQNPTVSFVWLCSSPSSNSDLLWRAVWWLHFSTQISSYPFPDHPIQNSPSHNDSPLYHLWNISLTDGVTRIGALWELKRQSSKSQQEYRHQSRLAQTNGQMVTLSVESTTFWNDLDYFTSAYNTGV